MRNAALKKIGLGLLWAIWTCLVLFLVQRLFALILSGLFRILPFQISSAAAQTIFSVLSYAFSILIILEAPKSIAKLAHKKFPKIKSGNFGVTKSDLGLNELPTWTDIGLAPVGLVAYAILAAVLTSLFSIFPWFNASETQDVGFNTLLLASDRVFAFATLVIIAPIAEELIFRGFLYQKIKALFFREKSSEKPNRKSAKKSEITAIIIATFITSLAFGIMHGQWNVGVNVFAMSVVLCIMREITGSIYSGILMHMLKNMVAFYLLYIATMGF